MDLIKLFRCRVVRFQVGILKGPCRGNAFLVLESGEVAIAHAHQGGGVDFSIAPYGIVGLRRERFSILVVPLLRGVVTLFFEHIYIGSVLFLQGHSVAPFQNQNTLARRCQLLRQGASTGPGAHNDYVVVLIINNHKSSL